MPRDQTGNRCRLGLLVELRIEKLLDTRAKLGVALFQRADERNRHLAFAQVVADGLAQRASSDVTSSRSSIIWNAIP